MIGTSIGAINAAIIAGNPPERRSERLNMFWSRIRHDPVSQMFGMMPWFDAAASNALTAIAGVKGFFEPHPAAIWGNDIPLGAERTAYYSVEPLRRSLLELVDFDLLNGGPTRLPVGAANVATGDMR